MNTLMDVVIVFTIFWAILFITTATFSEKMIIYIKSVKKFMCIFMISTVMLLLNIATLLFLSSNIIKVLINEI